MTFLPRTALVIGSLLTLGSVAGRSSAQEPPEPQDLANRVRSIFVAKCSECHGRGLARPRAALYLHELVPLAANREWVVPYEPEKSYLWALVRDDDMPAKGAKAGPLSSGEKEAIRAWIAAGAPVQPAKDAPPQPAPAPDSPGTLAPELALVSPSWATRLLGWLGRFHILVIHFPIALLTAAALREMLAARHGNRAPDPAVRFCILLGAAGAFAAVALGWLHADVGGHGGASHGILGLHRWLGTATGIWASAIVLVSERDSRRCQRSLLLRILLWSGSALVLITAHFGGLLVHGQAFFEM